jgi:hypothetical protein
MVTVLMGFSYHEPMREAKENGRGVTIASRLT